LLPDYLYNFLQSDKYWEQVEMESAAGATQYECNATCRRILACAADRNAKQIIAQLETQMQIARQVRTSAQSQLDAINALPAAYLRKAFRGDL